MRQKGKLFFWAGGMDLISQSGCLSYSLNWWSQPGQTNHRSDDQRQVPVLVTDLAGSDPAVETGITRTGGGAFKKDMNTKY